MKKIIISFLFVIMFPLYVSARPINDPNEPQTCSKKIYNLKIGETVAIPHEDIDNIADQVHYFDDEVCEYYLPIDENGIDDDDERYYSILKEGDSCYITPYYDYDELLLAYTDDWSTTITCPTLQGDEGPGTFDDFFNQENLSLQKVVYEINKGSLARKFKNDYNLKYIKAAYVGNTLVVQYAPIGGSITTLKMTYSRTGNSTKLQSSTIDINSATTNLLEQFPFWMLEAAKPDYETYLSGITKDQMLAAFKDIADYSYNRSNGKYTMSATIPDDINSRVKAVYSTFLDDPPLGNGIEPAASNNGQPSNEGNENTSLSETETSKGKNTSGNSIKKKVKNPKTGAFVNVKIVAIGFVIAFIGGYLVFRYNKIKKI